MTDLMPKPGIVDLDELVAERIEHPCFLSSKLEVGGYEVPTADKPRQILAMLLTEAGKCVPVTSLSRELWGDNPPPSATTTIQTYILNLRRLLGDVKRKPHLQVLHTVPGGYSLRITDPILVDVLGFMGTVRRLRLEGTETAEELRALIAVLENTFSLIRGPVLHDIERGPVLQNWLVTFNENYRRAKCLWTRAALKLRWYGEVISDLLPYHLDSPYDEDFVRWLMLALYCSNREAEALDLYRRLRTVKVRDLGLEPSLLTRDLHVRILREDREVLKNTHIFV